MPVQNNNDQIWVTVNATVNLGNFENIKIEVGLSRTIEEGEDPQELIRRTTKKLLTQVKEKAEEIKKEIEE